MLSNVFFFFNKESDFNDISANIPNESITFIKDINSIFANRTMFSPAGVEIINNLLSDSSTSALSAAQGKALKTLVDSKSPMLSDTDGWYGQRIKALEDALSGAIDFETQSY